MSAAPNPEFETSLGKRWSHRRRALPKVGHLTREIAVTGHPDCIRWLTTQRRDLEACITETVVLQNDGNKKWQPLPLPECLMAIPEGTQALVAWTCSTRGQTPPNPWLRSLWHKDTCGRSESMKKSRSRQGLPSCTTSSPSPTSLRVAKAEEVTGSGEPLV